MDMSIKSPLGRLPVKRSKVTECKAPIIPEEICLPDGRVFNTKELLKSKSKRESINLRKIRTPPKEKKTLTYHTPRKYTYGERVWIASATPEAVARRYPDVRPDYIASFIQQSKEIVFRIESQQDLILTPTQDKE